MESLGLKKSNCNQFPTCGTGPSFYLFNVNTLNRVPIVSGRVKFRICLRALRASPDDK